MTSPQDALISQIAPAWQVWHKSYRYFVIWPLRSLPLPALLPPYQALSSLIRIFDRNVIVSSVLCSMLFSLKEQKLLSAYNCYMHTITPFQSPSCDRLTEKRNKHFEHLEIEECFRPRGFSCRNKAWEPHRRSLQDWPPSFGIFLKSIGQLSKVW